jgi:hypothetical protein
MRRALLLALFPLRYYVYLTTPAAGRPAASLTVAEPDMADWLTA